MSPIILSNNVEDELKGLKQYFEFHRELISGFYVGQSLSQKTEQFQQLPIVATISAEIVRNS